MAGPTPITVDEIVRITAEIFGVEVSDILGDRRGRDFVRARHAAIYLAKRKTKLSMVQIGHAFGGRDHTTIIHALNKVGERIDDDPDYGNEIDATEKRLDAQASRAPMANLTEAALVAQAKVVEAFKATDAYPELHADPGQLSTVLKAGFDEVPVFEARNRSGELLYLAASDDGTWSLVVETKNTARVIESGTGFRDVRNQVVRAPQPEAKQSPQAPTPEAASPIKKSHTCLRCRSVQVEGGFVCDDCRRKNTRDEVFPGAAI